MFRRSLLVVSLVSVAALLTARDASAACMNKFVARSEGNTKVVTLLTGKLTFDQAKTLITAVNNGQAPPIQWLNESGRTVATQLGLAKVIRPMPVGCDGNTSGVVMVVSFMSPNTPHGKLSVKLDGNAVQFEEQTN
jgi:hypothetical protein